MPADTNDPNLPKEVHVEREKTKRTLIIASAITIVGVLATVLFFQNVTNRGGTLKVTDKGVEVTLEQPITTQLGTTSENVKVFGDSVTLTTGTISDSALRSIPGVKTDGAFSGQNLIDTAEGFVLSSDRPTAWTVERKQDGLQRLSANDGSEITVATERVTRAVVFDRVLHRLLDSLQRSGTKADPYIDTTFKTALVWYRDPLTQEHVCIKFVQANNMIYTAKATTKDPSSVESLKKSVAGFTVIDKPIAITPSVKTPRVIVPGTRRLPR